MMFVVVALLGACVDGFAMPRGCEEGVGENKKQKEKRALLRSFLCFELQAPPKHYT